MAVGTSSTVEQSWFIAQRWQAYEAESRANLLRIIAIGAFYLVHLWSYFSAQGRFPALLSWRIAEAGDINQRFHIAVTMLAATWAMLALGILLALQHQIFPRWLPYFSTGCDIILLTGVICLGAAARSPLIAAYFLILVLATLRLSLPLVWFATAGCALGYVAVLGCAKWPETLGFAQFHSGKIALDESFLRVPRYHQIIVLLSMLLAGVMLGQIVRRVRGLAERLACSIHE